MMQESLINNPLLASIAITLIHFLWQGVLVALALKLLLSLISYRKSQTRYALASFAMLTNLTLPLITFFIVYDIDHRQAINFVQALPLLDQSFYLEQVQVNAWYIEWLEYLPAISIFWLSVVGILSIKLLAELYNVNKLPLQGSLSVDPALQNRFESLVNKIGLTKKVTLLLSSKTDVPVAIGWLKPVVLIPFSMVSGLTPLQLDMLLLHELAHIRRHDYLVNFLQTLVETLLFFHPTVRWVSKQMRNEREYCSDDIAVQHGSSALAYAHALADTASLCQKHRHHAIPNMAMAASGGDLKQRVVRLLDSQPHCTQTTDSGKWLASFTILLAIIFCFSKYSLTLPIIDLQSGTISLTHSPIKQNKSSLAYSPLALETINTNSSLANQLIAINSTGNAFKGNHPEKGRNNNNKHLTNTNIKSGANTQQKTLAKKQSILRQSIKKSDYNELPIVLASKQEQSIKQTYAKLEKKSVAAAVKSINSTAKSMSDLAFERTDSKSNTTTFSNPYSQQVATLSDIPKASYVKLNAAHSEQPTKISAKELSNSTYSSNFDNNYTAEFSNKAKTQYSLAKLIKSAEPRYPSSAKRKGIELEIMVEFNIDKNGLVTNIQFESKSKVNYFRSAIRNAMTKWRFLPAKENGLAVESNMSKIFSFSLLR